MGSVVKEVKRSAKKIGKQVGRSASDVADVKKWGGELVSGVKDVVRETGNAVADYTGAVVNGATAGQVNLNRDFKLEKGKSRMFSTLDKKVLNSQWKNVRTPIVAAGIAVAAAYTGGAALGAYGALAGSGGIGVAGSTAATAGAAAAGTATAAGAGTAAAVGAGAAAGAASVGIGTAATAAAIGAASGGYADYSKRQQENAAKEQAKAQAEYQAKQTKLANQADFINSIYSQGAEQIAGNAYYNTYKQYAGGGNYNAARFGYF